MERFEKIEKIRKEKGFTEIQRKLTDSQLGNNLERKSKIYRNTNLHYPRREYKIRHKFGFNARGGGDSRLSLTPKEKIVREFTSTSLKKNYRIYRKLYFYHSV